jgi:hypothetical protein
LDQIDEYIRLMKLKYKDKKWWLFLCLVKKSRI